MEFSPKLKLIVGIALLFAVCVVAPRGDRFTKDLYETVVADKYNENVVFSPVSVETSVALLLYGAGGETEKQIRESIDFNESKNGVAEYFGTFLKENFISKPDGPELSMANKFYVNEGVEVQADFAEIAKTYYGAEPETLNFADSKKSVEYINSYVQSQTHNKIKDLLSPSDVSAETTSIIVNAAYFKGAWEKPFFQSLTEKSDFCVTDSNKVPVDFMYNSEYFKYGEFPEFDAKAVVLPYKNTDLYMLIILPNKVDGLQALEKKFPLVQFKTGVNKMQKYKVDLKLPKFNFDFELNLEHPFKEMGMTNFFGETADFKGLFTTPTYVDKGVHKAFISVDEFGTEAAATASYTIVPTSSVTGEEIKQFHADHPFMFVIFNGKTAYFAGHVAKF